jgi:nitronate monooxygenase
MVEGEVDFGAWSCSMVAGLISDIPFVKELIGRLIAEANAIVTQRLTSFFLRIAREPGGHPDPG